MQNCKCEIVALLERNDLGENLQDVSLGKSIIHDRKARLWTSSALKLASPKTLKREFKDEPERKGIYKPPS